MNRLAAWIGSVAALALASVVVLSFSVSPAEADNAKPRTASPTVSGSSSPQSSGSATATRSSGGSRSSARSGSSSSGSARSSSAGRRAINSRRSVGASLRHRGTRYFHPYYHSPYSRFHYGLGFGYGYYYYPFYYPFGYGYWGPSEPYRYRAGEYGLGALDLNVRPKKAQVWLDGEYIGLVREFDGWPDFLWLERGSHELIFYHPGYRTELRRFRVHPGVVVDVELRLALGDAAPPEEVTQARLDERAGGRYGTAETPAGDRDMPQAPRAPAPAPAPSAASSDLDLREEPGRVRLAIEPGDASVYLDGRFLGTGVELAQLHAGLIVDAGEHLLEVQRPGFDAKQLDFRIATGEEVELSVRLDPQ